VGEAVVSTQAGTLMKALKAFESGIERIAEIEKIALDHTDRLEKGKERIAFINDELSGVRARFDAIDAALANPHTNCNYTAVSQQLLAERLERESIMQAEKTAIVNTIALNNERLLDIQYKVAGLQKGVTGLSESYSAVKQDLFDVDKEKAVNIAELGRDIQNLRTHMDNGFQQKLIERLMGMEERKHMTRKQLIIELIKMLAIIFGSGGFAVVFVEFFQKH
jgi:hypothetical protein